LSTWKIERIKNACAGCEQEFENDQRVYSVIEFDVSPEGLPERTDYCKACLPAEREGKAFWETRWQIPAPKKKQVDFDRLFVLLETWLARPAGAETSKESEALMYLVALLLIRKRFFKMLDLTTHQGKECLRLRRPGPNRPDVFVPAPLLRPDELPALRASLETLIDGVVDDQDLPEETMAEDEG
jgi:hypothetical protein